MTTDDTMKSRIILPLCQKIKGAAMYLNITTLKQLFSKNDPILFVRGQLLSLTAFHRLAQTPKPLHIHTLYIAESVKELSEDEDYSNINILISESAPRETLTSLIPESARLANILFVKEMTSLEIFHVLEDYFNEITGLGELSDSLLHILINAKGTDAIQKMVTQTYMAVQNPIYVFDAGFNLIAFHYGSDHELSEEARQMIATGGFSANEFKIVNRENFLHNKVMKSETPVENMNPALGIRQLYCTISASRNLGHIVMDSVNHDITSIDRKFIYLLKQSIRECLQKDEFTRKNRGENDEFILNDLLNNKMQNNPYFAERMRKLTESYGYHLYVLLIKTDLEDRLINTRVTRNIFELLYPEAKSLIYNGNILFLIGMPEGKEMQRPDYEKIRELCRKYELSAGISNCFHDITDLRNYYRQAMTAIEIGLTGEGKPDLFLYRDQYMSHLLRSFSNEEKPQIFCHPALKLLFDYDKKNNTELAETLYCWLAEERNASHTAEAMHVHRNTVIYRLKKIEELTNVDWNDFKERQYAVLSYEYAMQNN